MSINALAHVGLAVKSIEATSEWYSKYFGFATPRDKFPYATPWIGTMVGYEGAKFTLGFLALDDLTIELAEYEVPGGRVAVSPDPTYVGCFHLAIAVPDIQSLYERMTADGVVFLGPPSRVTEGRFEGFIGAYCRDPDGYIVELNEAPPEGIDIYELVEP